MSKLYYAVYVQFVVDCDEDESRHDIVANFLSNALEAEYKKDGGNKIAGANVFDNLDSIFEHEHYLTVFEESIRKHRQFLRDSGRYDEIHNRLRVLGR